MSRQTGNCAHSIQDLVQSGDILLRKCNICLDSIFGAGTRFQCNGCSDCFHEICIRPQATLQHSFYPDVIFSFSQGQGTAGQNSQKCVACYKSIQGAVYVSTNDIHIHPFCLVNLTKSVSDDTINFHKKQMVHLLKTSGDRRVAISLDLECQMSLSVGGGRCFICRQKDTIIRNFGWAYKYTYTAQGRSTKFECHVACLRAKLNNNFLNQIVNHHPGSTYDQNTYFLDLNRSKLEKSARDVAGLALPVAVAGLDLMISAFVGSPLLSCLLSCLLEAGADKVITIYPIIVSLEIR